MKNRRRSERTIPDSSPLPTAGDARQVTLLKYLAPHFGYIVHVHQNEKLMDFGCVIVAAVNGASHFVINFIVMPPKNTFNIYADYYVPHNVKIRVGILQTNLRGQYSIYVATIQASPLHRNEYY
ncbi:hypothetical protein Y032_0042g494 [Ancylostoma ceylanicum]|uniref:Uncharacterized protein n=1 Tax=Ancylostoma ceylanicum TaxID=53326 RepID=A0A016UFQ5_9BILA|nr:hypothetical protein Y032_0042g494 [Ancylostoma ceylanicum]